MLQRFPLPPCHHWVRRSRPFHHLQNAIRSGLQASPTPSILASQGLRRNLVLQHRQKAPSVHLLTHFFETRAPRTPGHTTIPRRILSHPIPRLLAQPPMVCPILLSPPLKDRISVTWDGRLRHFRGLVPPLNPLQLQHRLRIRRDNLPRFTIRDHHPPPLLDFHQSIRSQHLDLPPSTPKRLRHHPCLQSACRGRPQAQMRRKHRVIRL